MKTVSAALRAIRPCAHAQGYNTSVARRVSGGTGASAGRRTRSALAALATALALAAATPAAFAAAPAPAAADAAKSADPSAMLRAAVDEVIAIAYPATPAAADIPLAVRVRPTLEKYFSFDRLTSSAVGPAWKDFTPAQQQRAITLFTEIIIRSYAQKFEPGDRPKVTYGKPVEIDAARRELPSTITYAGKNYAVAYRVRSLPEGWRIYDVNIEGVSMVANYRAQFDPIAQKKDGAAALIAALEKNIADFNAEKK
jgi:phospholipid transport system substrate-binding protein